MQRTLLTVLFLCSSLLAHAPQARAQGREPLFSTPQRELRATVESLIDSATFRLADGRKIKLIGLIPLKRPKPKEPLRNEYNIIIEDAAEDPVVPLEETAYDFIRSLVIAQKVRLEFDQLYRDPEGYILAYVFTEDGTLVNAEILRQGFSELRITPPNTKYEQKLRDAYLEARREKRGLQGN